MKPSDSTHQYRIRVRYTAVDGRRGLRKASAENEN